MSKAGVIGDYDSIYGFASLGLEIYPLEKAEQAEDAVKELVRRGCGLIFITEQAAHLCEETLESYSEQPSLAFVLIPGLDGNTGAGDLRIRRWIKQAAGSEID